MTVHRGYDGNRPTRLSASLPVRAGVDILSGQIVSIRRNTTTGENEWSLGYLANTDRPNSFYFAFDDSNDGDVRAAGNLQGLSVSGDYELSTAHYKSGESYIVGDELTYDGVTGNVKKATSGDIVIAVIVKDYAAPVDHAAQYTPAEATGPVSDGVQGGEFVLATHSNAEDLTLIRFETVNPYVKA